MADPAPVDDSLDLGVNETYRDAIMAASKRTGMSPRAVASVISAEAAKARKTGAWLPESHNAKTDAAGLTQFIQSTWRGEAQIPGRAVYDAAIDAPEDGNFMDTRYDPNLSIMAAAQYDSAGLANLQRQGLVPQDLTETQAARYAYLYHHEGPSSASKILKGTFTDKDGRRELPSQVDPPGDHTKSDALIAAAGGDAAKAYQDWLWSYINANIKPDNFKAKPTLPWPWPVDTSGTYQIQRGDPTVFLGTGLWPAAHVTNPHEGGGTIAQGSYTVGIGALRLPFARQGDPTTDPGVIKGFTQPDILVGGPRAATTAGSPSFGPYGSLPSRASFGLPPDPPSPYGAMSTLQDLGGTGH